MTWVPWATSLLVACATAALSGPVLRQIPEPMDDPDAADKVPYSALATPWFGALVGLLSGASSLLAFHSVPAAHSVAWAALSAPGALAVSIDGVTTWIPRQLSWAIGAFAAAGVALAWMVTGDANVPLRAAIGTLLIGGFFWLAWRLSGAIGFGDVRLMAAVGCVTAAYSTQLAMASVILGTSLGAIWGIVTRVRRGKVPFAYGPSLWAGAFLALVWPTLH